MSEVNPPIWNNRWAQSATYRPRIRRQEPASPRRADGLLVTGPASENMRPALRKRYEAIPEPRIVIAWGERAISGGPYAGHPEVCGGAGAVVPADLYVPGCPPHPVTLRDGLLRLPGSREPGWRVSS